MYKKNNKDVSESEDNESYESERSIYSEEEDNNDGSESEQLIRSKKGKDNESESEQSTCSEEEDNDDKSKSEGSEKELDPNDPSDIRNIVIKTIDKAGNFGLGIYGDFKVYVMLKNNKERGYIMGYVNATKMCALVGKRFDNWMKNKESKNMVARFSENSSPPTIIGAHNLLITVIGGKNKIITGTYADPLLIPYIAAWASHDFAKRVSLIVNEVLVKKIIDEKNREIQEKNRELYKKRCKIDKMSAKIDKLLSDNKEQRSKTDKLLSDNKEQRSKTDKLLNVNEIQRATIEKMDRRIKLLVAQNDEIYEEVHEVNGKLSTVVDARVVPTDNPNDNNMLVIIKNNDNPDDYNDCDVIYDYYCMRIMIASYNTSISKHKQRHPNMEILLKLSYSPNSINLFKRVKDGLSKKIEFSKCSFNLKKGFTEKKLLQRIREIHNERLNTNDI